MKTSAKANGRGIPLGGLRYELRDVTSVEHANAALRAASYAETHADMGRALDDAINWYAAAVEDLKAIRERVRG